GSMFCQYCGNQLDDGAQFCRSCGKPTTLPAPRVVVADPLQVLSNHLRIMVVLWVVYSGFRIVLAVWTLFFARYFLPMIEAMLEKDSGPLPFPMFQFARVFYTVSFFYGIATGILGVIAGYGLLQRKPWGRIVALIAAFIGVISIPFGTAMAIYTLLILLPEHADREYLQLAATP
ncbi:MAG: zinc ribbon domain-containing protein, partial [Terriglobales bacterium]